MYPSNAFPPTPGGSSVANAEGEQAASMPISMVMEYRIRERLPHFLFDL
jgi:hypothetical protein